MWSRTSAASVRMRSRRRAISCGTTRAIPIFLEFGQLGAEIVFGSGRLFASFDEFPAEQSAMMYGLMLGGTQDWAVAVPDANDIFMQRQAQPAVGPGGSLYLTGLNSQSGWSLVRFDQNTGSAVWSYTQSPANGMSPPSVAPDGSIYLSRSLSFLDAVTPSGDNRWTYFDGSIIDLPRVSAGRERRRRGRSPELR